MSEQVIFVKFELTKLNAVFVFFNYLCNKNSNVQQVYFFLRLFASSAKSSKRPSFSLCTDVWRP